MFMDVASVCIMPVRGNHGIFLIYSTTPFQAMDSLAVALLDRVTEMADNPNDVTGVASGFYDLDRRPLVFRPGI